MKKVWNTPEFETLNVNATAYSPYGGTYQDGCYSSYDGDFNIPTFAPSSGNSGTPDVEVHH